MDYGSSTQPSDKEQPFFTAGVGNAPVDQNISENNIDLTNQATNWDFTATPGRNFQNIGNQAIFSAENTAKNLPSDDILGLDTPRLGEIVDTEPTVPAKQSTEGVSNVSQFNQNAIRTDGDHLARGTMTEVDNAMARFSQTRRPAAFYDEIRDMMEKNLKNSFNRELK